MATDFRAKFWGVRGTITCSGPSTARYGGATACIELLCSGQRLILDAGTGIRSLGKSIMGCGKGGPIHILLSHTHFDHILGLPYFAPAYCSSANFELWAGHLLRSGTTLKTVLRRLVDPPYFPVPLGIMHACIAFHDFEAGAELDLGLPGITVATLPLNHPGGATAYRIGHAGRSFCYVTDTEHLEIGLDQSIVAFIRDADVMVYDATYTDAEYPRFRGWGHSTWQMGVQLCRAAGVPKLIAFHHDPDHDDDTMDAIGAELAAALPGSLVAREGMELVL